MQKIAEYLAIIAGILLQADYNFKMAINSWRNRRKTEGLLKQIVFQIKTLGEHYGVTGPSISTQQKVWRQLIDTYEPIVFHQREKEKKEIKVLLYAMKKTRQALDLQNNGQKENFDTLTSRKLYEATTSNLEEVKRQLNASKDIEENFKDIRLKAGSTTKFVCPNFTTEDSVRYNRLYQGLKTICQFQVKILFNLDNVYEYSMQTPLQETDIFNLGRVTVNDGN